MSNILEAITNRGRAAWNVAKALGPLFLSQSEAASVRYLNYKLQVGRVEAMNALVLRQAEVVANIQKALLERYAEAVSAEERFRLRQDIEATTQELHRLQIYEKALHCLPPDHGSGRTQEAIEIDTPWLDRFNEIARLANEPWRSELLARALAIEAQQPGTIALRALWFLGTVEATIFHAFESLLDVSSNIAGGPMVPGAEHIADQVVPCELGPHTTLGNLLFFLGEVGLYSDPIRSQRTLVPDVDYLCVLCRSPVHRAR